MICEIENGFCKRHATQHPESMLRWCLDPSETGEKVRLALDVEFAKQIEDYKAKPPQKKSGCKGCGKAGRRELDAQRRQSIRDKLFGGILHPRPPILRKGCTDCGAESKTK